MKRSLTVFALAALTLAPAFAQAQDVAGKVMMLTGRATATGSNGTIRKLAKGDAVYSGDLLNSSIGSYVNVRFEDGAFFLLRPETRFQIEEYRYKSAAAAVTAAPTPVAPNAAKAPSVTAPLIAAAQGAEGEVSRAFFRLVKGGFRSVSGLIGKLNRDDYRVSTPVATIGIRGTEYSARLCDGACEDRGEINDSLASAGQAVPSDAPVLITTVSEGEIGVQTPENTASQPACREGSLVNGTLVETCGAMLTVGNGANVITPRRPTVEQNERSVDPKACL